MRASDEQPRMTRISREARHSPFRRVAGLSAVASAEVDSPFRRSKSFTLLELLIVLGIVGLLLVLIVPSFTSIKGGTDMTSAAYTIKGVLDTARTYAKANNTYVWVGFLEENVENPASPNSSPPPVGRVIMSVVASKDGTMLYAPPLTTLVPLPSASLIQVGKLTKIENVHLKTFPDPTATPPPDNFDTRPTPGTAPNDLTARIGNDASDPATSVAPANPLLRFQYPLSGSASYTFGKIIQFSPRGEAVIDNPNYTFTRICEVGLEPTHGAAVPASTPANVVAIQFVGLGGDVKIYRK